MATEPDIRFSLANERTFLAWVRTSIALVAAGVAVFHLLDGSAANTALAVLLLLTGALAVSVGLLNFRRADRAIRTGQPLPTRGAQVVVMTVVVLLAAVAGIVSVLIGG